MWAQVRHIGANTLWKTAVAHAPATMDTLLVQGVRAISARYPDADPEHDRFPIGYITKGGRWTAPADLGEPQYIEYPVWVPALRTFTEYTCARFASFSTGRSRN